MSWTTSSTSRLARLGVQLGVQLLDMILSVPGLQALREHRPSRSRESSSRLRQCGHDAPLSLHMNAS